MDTAGYQKDAMIRHAIDKRRREGRQKFLGRSINDPELYNLVPLLRDIQLSGSLGIRIEAYKSNKERAVFVFRQRRINTEAELKISGLKKILGL